MREPAIHDRWRTISSTINITDHVPLLGEAVWQLVVRGFDASWCAILRGAREVRAVVGPRWPIAVRLALLAVLCGGCQANAEGFQCGEMIPGTDTVRRCSRPDEVCVCASRSCASIERRCAAGFAYLEPPFARGDSRLQFGPAAESLDVEDADAEGRRLRCVAMGDLALDTVAPGDLIQRCFVEDAGGLDVDAGPEEVDAGGRDAGGTGG